jgi:sulfur-oxidizing protein SoxA
MKPAIALAAATLTALVCTQPLARDKVAVKPAKAPVAAAPTAADSGKDTATAEFEKFREVMEDSNPAELFEAKGEELWKNKRGPKNVSLADTCDLGLGVGVIQGAYVQMPRYFADAGKVMDAERRIVWCMVEKQGFSSEELAAKPFANENHTPDATSLVTFVAGGSRNMKIAAPEKDPHVAEAYRLGREVFNYRAGPYDFACATCHGEDGKRIRMQQLPNLARKEEAIRAYQGWPGYRMTGGFMLTQQWRMNDCFRQQRFPEPRYVSDTVTALLTYLTVNANGNVYKGPGIKR